jgi:glyoxylase-like metal-dependent hydrolase (beta-lactamase superfamily II)
MAEPNAHFPGDVQLFETQAGAQIYQIPLQAFPGLWGYAYLVRCTDPKLGEMRVLIDSGSGVSDSNQHLEAGLAAVGEKFGWQVDFSDLTHILITHGHIDHFGGLNFVRQRTSAPLGIHELDRRILANYEERLSLIAQRLNEFLIEAGVEDSDRADLISMYRLTKSLFRSVQVDFTYEKIGMRLGPFEMLHVPGHCAGHVVIRLQDVLFSGDHVLNETSPHQAPEQLTLSTGLDHYLKSLEALRPWGHQARLTLGGHKQPILDLEGRIDQIHKLHMDRLQKVLDLLEKPLTIAQVSASLFGGVYGYNALLALEEAGAHVEYLYQRGLLEIANLPQLEASDLPVPIIYRCVQCHLEEG